LSVTEASRLLQIMNQKLRSYVRYLRELRHDPEKLKRVFVDTPTGAQVPLAQLATL
jgi:multidrug efflux pump subunit AcrB